VGLFIHLAAVARRVSEEPGLDAILDVLSDEYAREILAATSVKPLSAQQLADACEMSEPTVYRRVERLREHDLLGERTEIRDDGNHHSVYTATLSELSVALDEGTFEATVERREAASFPGQRESDTADRFAKMWENL
jgi:DNA-binding transcriptional ArsR family regulator